MLDDFILNELEKFLQAEDKKSLSEYRDSAASQELNLVASTLERIATKSKTNNRDQDLIRSAKLGYARVVSLLLDAGANKDTTDEESEYGDTALIVAACRGHTAVVEVLLKAGANKEATDSYDSTVLMEAASHGKAAVVELLLKAGANKEARNIHGNTALIHAAIEGQESLVEVLLRAGANKEAVDTDECTALMCAAYAGHASSVEVLLKAGANKEAIDYRGGTALMYAAYSGQTAVVEVLLRAGVEVDAMDDECKTALNWAIHSSNDVEGSQKENTVKALISYGANPFLRVGSDFMNHDPENPLAGYSEDILNYIALSEHAEGFCAAASTDSPEVEAIKADMSKRCSRMSALRSIYQQELDCYQSTCALHTAARSIHPNYDTKETVGHNLNDVEVDRPQARQCSDDALRRNLRDGALSIVSLNMFLPISVDSADDANEKCSASEARARFFSSVRKRMAAKYQAALVEKQLVPAGDVVEFTAIESEAVLQKIEANINQQAQREDVMNLAP